MNLNERNMMEEVVVGERERTERREEERKRKRKRKEEEKGREKQREGPTKKLKVENEEFEEVCLRNEEEEKKRKGEEEEEKMGKELKERSFEVCIFFLFFLGEGERG